MFRETPIFKPEEILVYLRKSRSDDQSMSVEEVLEKHESIINEWIANNLDSPIPEENWYREVLSGETINSRPEFRNLLKRMESPRIKAVICVDCQRLGRPDLEDIGKISKLFRYTNTYVITQHRAFDLNDDYDREQFERELMRGNDYLEYFKKIQRRGIEISVQDGNYLGSIPPYGYDKIKVLVGKKKCPTLSVNKDEARVVQMIFNWYDEGIGSTTICHRLNSMGIPTRNGGRWTKPTIQSILANEHYIGKIRFYYRVTSHSVVESEIVKGTKYNSDYEVFDGKHDAIIDEDLFYRVNSKKHRIARVKSSTTLQNPLASLLYCKCGSCMNYTQRKGKRWYTCDSQTYCHTSSTDATTVLSAVCDALKESIDNITVQMSNDDHTVYEQQQEHIAFLKKRLVELEEKEISIWEKYSEDGMPRAIFESLKKKCEDEKATVEEALRQANNLPKPIDYRKKIVSLHQALDALMDDSIPATTKNNLLKSIVKKIEYSKQPSVRMSKEEAKEKGLNTVNGWLVQDLELNVSLKI